MAGWTRDYRNRFEDSFYAFLERCFINSKDTGRICLGSNLFYGQRLFYTTVFDALEADIHNIFCLKSRQLGISTGARALSVFYLGVHAGLKGALVFDTAPHKEEARAELVTMIHDLPNSLKFPKPQGAMGRGNRDALTLSNDSRMLFMSAGVKRSKSSGTLGRSSGLTFAHCSELCSYDNPEGMKSFEQSLSEVHPNRLYMKESTARGYNDWYDAWTEARADDAHNACLFIGFWSKESQAISQNDPDFARYGIDPPTAQEEARMKAVHEQYGFKISVEQLAWIRRKVNPTAVAEGDADPDFEPEDTIMLAEQAWTESEAFQQTGSKFFSSETLTAITNQYASSKFKTYQFQTGIEFTDMKIQKAETARNVELKVWEEPDEVDGVYVLGIDPAYGENEANCRSAIQVLRCYADGIDQVAEYAWPLINTRQLAWVIAALLGWYGSGKAEARYILELNGPGTAVYNEIRSLKHLIESKSYLDDKLREQGLKDVFRNVRTYIYQRPDSLGPGFNMHFKTNTQLKITILERLRDYASNGMLHLHSLATIDEMKKITRMGDSIAGEGTAKDDRVIALALALYYWETGIRRTLITQKMTRLAVEAKKTRSITSQVALFNQNSLSAFFQEKAAQRFAEQRMMQRAAWRGRR